ERKPIQRKLNFSFPPTQRTGRDVLLLEGISKNFGELELYKNLSKGVYSGDRIAIIGINGIGKTTLLKIMAEELKPDSGTVRMGANVEVGYYAQHHTELLHPSLTILEEVRLMKADASETFLRGVCGAFLFSGDDVDKAVGVLSGGERARVLLARLLIRPGNLLLMDEPTNHLDIASSEALAQALDSYDGTLVFVSHNTSFVNRLATKIWDIVDGDIVEYPGNLTEYLEHLDLCSTKDADPVPEVGRATPPEKARGSRHAEKERKRKEAQLRDEFSRKSRKVREEIAQLEERISSLEKEQEDLEPKLADPNLYQDQGQFRELFGQYDKNKSKLIELYDRWEHKQAQLEKLQAEYEVK
ncbi:MAG: ATP-binding cassette domain-containing protein, partial [Pseudomonadota bacterium]